MLTDPSTADLTSGRLVMELVKRAAHLLFCRTPMVVLVAAGLTLVAVLLWPWSTLPVVLLLVMGALVRKLCVYCAAELPLDPAGLVHRYRRSLWLVHRVLRLPSRCMVMFFVWLSLLGLAATLTVTIIADQAWMAMAALYATVFPWLLLADVVGRHERVSLWCPWCPWCRDDDDPARQPEPDPDPAGRKPQPVNA